MHLKVKYFAKNRFWNRYGKCTNYIISKFWIYNDENILKIINISLNSIRFENTSTKHCGTNFILSSQLDQLWKVTVMSFFLIRMICVIKWFSEILPVSCNHFSKTMSNSNTSLAYQVAPIVFFFVFFERFTAWL